MPKNPVKKMLDFDKVRSDFLREINLWLGEAEKQRKKREAYDVGSFCYNSCWDAENTFFSMAHAVYMAGEGVGVVSTEDFPQFAQKSEAET